MRPIEQVPSTSAASSSSKQSEAGGTFFGPEEDPHRYTMKEELGTGATATVCRRGSNCSVCCTQIDIDRYMQDHASRDKNRRT